jgi:hypothetical protein
MPHLAVRPISKLARGLLVPSIVAAALACGSSGEGGDDPDPSPSSGGTGGGAPANSPAPANNAPGASTMPSPEDIAAVTDALGMVAGQVQAACGARFEACGATPGCTDILSCAARNACSGADCYCLGAGCTMDGPCRSVIDSAPGARVPDANDPSLGPASDAARAVGDCLQGLSGGLPSTPTPPAPARNEDAGVSDGG